MPLKEEKPSLKDYLRQRKAEAEAELSLSGNRLSISLESQVRPEAQATQPIDWAARKAKWLEELGQFMAQVMFWLLEEMEEGLIEVADKDFALSEKHLGEYQALGLVITAAGQKVELAPVGHVIMGAAGRVDLAGKRDSFKFLLNPGQPGWFYLDEEDKKRLRPLDKALFDKLLLRLLG